MKFYIEQYTGTGAFVGTILVNASTKENALKAARFKAASYQYRRTFVMYSSAKVALQWANGVFNTNLFKNRIAN